VWSQRRAKRGAIQANALGPAFAASNLSDDAARLNAKTAETPGHLTMAIVAEKLIRKCRVIWRDGNKMGVVLILHSDRSYHSHSPNWTARTGACFKFSI